VNEICVVGLNHRTAPVALRERVAAAADGALAGLRGLAREVAVLATCNRFEVYTAGGAGAEAVSLWLATRSGIDCEALRAHLYVREGRNAAKHLFFVASSLDSLVVGETQIRKQVKQAYAAAVEAGTAGPALHALFQAALRVSKEIASATGVGRGTVSVAGAAADLAERIFGELEPARLLLVGAGETAELLLSHMRTRGVRHCVVANRTPEHAEALARRFEARAAPLDDLARHLDDADILVAAAPGQDGPLVGVPQLRAALRRRRGHPIVVIDVAVPRAVDPHVDALDNVYRYDIDALVEVTTDALRRRRRDFLQCCTLVDAAALRLEVETRSREAGTAIAELEEEYRRLGDEELKSLEARLPFLDESARAEVRRAFHRLIRRFLHAPVRALREGDSAHAQAVRRAFSAKRRRDA